MGLSTQLSGHRMAAIRRSPRRGAAIATALFAITATAILTAGVHWMTRADIRTTSNRESALRALTLAEMGLAHTLGLMRDSLGDTTMTRFLRGWDGNASSESDNGRLVGYNLKPSQEIPTTGVATADGKYFVRLTDDPAEVDGDTLTDRNTRLLAICDGVTNDGASVRLNAVVGNTSLAGLAVNGNLEISGTTNLAGRCGGVHTNGSLKLGTTITVETKASATGTMTGTAKNTYGETLPNHSGAPSAEFPNITAAEYCGRADYVLRSDGTVLDVANATLLTPLLLGWTGSGGMWEPKSTVVEATYCVEGNVKISTAVGTSSSPKKISLLVKGSMEISGNPYLRPEDPDGIMFIMDGDLKLNGNSILSAESFNGFIYAGSQCEMSGTLHILGQVICANKPNPPGAEAWVAENKIAGTTKITYACRGFLSQIWRVISWYPTIGT